MIVKNEAERIERCLRSVLPYVKAAAILDTGSTDNTREIIARVAAEFEVPTFVHGAIFKDFGQARNDAFHCAQRINGGCLPWCQFALMMDADMELVVDEGYNFDDLDANALSYDMKQRCGYVSYANRRIVNLDWGQKVYEGVTHEYIDVPAAGMITSARFIDHADGSNRTDKYPRDAALLDAALKVDPTNARNLFYLGNTYRDWGKPKPAIKAYTQRITTGGWDEETYQAMLSRAGCYKDQGDIEGYLAGMIEAYNFRPQRAEPLYDLAKHFREKGQNAAALLFAKAGIDTPRPDDMLFVNDFVYDYGMRYEYSIAGFYSQAERSRAYAVTNDLALDPTCPAAYRWSARNNLQHFTRPLSDCCPSFVPTKLDFTAPDGYTAMNPSVEECNGTLRVNIRCVNYKMDEQGRYMIGAKECNDAPIDTRNFVCRLSDSMKVFDPKEIIWHRDTPNFNMVTGLEDVRLYRSRGSLWFNACVRERSLYGTCQQIRGQLMDDAMDNKFISVAPGWEIMSGDTQHEKNWMAMPHDGLQDFIYRLDTIKHMESPDETKFPVSICPDNISGSSQLIPFRGGWIAVVHEAIHVSTGLRNYWHRFAYFDKSGHIQRLSKPFFFFGRQIEFCAGLCEHPIDKKLLVVSFGVKDAEAHVATVSAEEVAMFLWSQS